MASVTWPEVVARRVSRSSLARRTGGDRLVDVVRELGGVQAQVQVSADLQLAARVEGITQGDVRDALWQRRALAKAWTVRGTLHLHPADELPLWYAAKRAASPSASNGLEAWTDPHGALHPALTADDVTATRAAVWEALDGRCLRREEIADAVADRVGPASRGRLLSGFAFFLGELCQGPPQGAKVTFVRPDQWVDGWSDADEHDALLEVCRRFLRAFGPSRPTEFREWFSPSLTPAAARAAFDALGDELVQADVEGHQAFLLAGDTDFPRSASGLRLLPEYDAYVMGFREREQLVPEAVRRQVAAGGRGRYEGPAGVLFVIVDGVAAGLWRRRKKGRRVEIDVAPTRRLTKAQRDELDDEVERIGAFLGLEPVVTVS
jgi:hypothetical protein